MDSPSAVIRALGGPVRVAAALGISSASVVAKWGARESIPGRYWLPLAERASDQAVPVTVATLAALHRAEAR